MAFRYPLDVQDLRARIDKRGAALKNALALPDDARDDDVLNALAWEVGRGWFPVLPDGSTTHSGLDLGLPDADGDSFYGAPVVAIADGEVVYTDQASLCSPEGYEFNRVIVRHPTPQGDAYALYLHLSEVKVWPGSTVSEGELLGRVGWHGSFHHLHFAIASPTPLGGDELQPEARATALPQGDAVWNVLRVQVDELDPKEWPWMPGGSYYLHNPVELVRALRGEEYRHYVGRARGAQFQCEPQTSTVPVQPGKENTHEVAGVLSFEPLASNARLHALASGADDQLKRGDKDKDAVTAVQRALAQCQYSLGRGGPDKDGIDGDFGKTTERVLKKFQVEVLPTMKDLLALFGVGELPKDGVLDRWTLLALDARAVGEKAAPPPEQKPAPANTGSPPPPPERAAPPSTSFKFDGKDKRLSLEFGLRMYKVLLRWELCDENDKVVLDPNGEARGCYYSANAGRECAPYAAAYDAILGDVEVNKRYRPRKDKAGVYPGEGPCAFIEWPSLEMFPEIEADGDPLQSGGKKYEVYNVMGVQWVATNRTNCCNSQVAAFFVAAGGHQVTVATEGKDRTYWMRDETKDVKDARIGGKRAMVVFERAMMNNDDAKSPDKDDAGNQIQDFPNRGGTLSALRALGIGDAVAGDGNYTTDQQILKQVRLGDSANTPGHSWLVADVKYGLWFEPKPGKKAPTKPDVVVCQSSFAVPQFGGPGGEVRLGDAELDWVIANEQVFLERVQKFVDECDGGSFQGKKLSRFEVVDLSKLSANGRWDKDSLRAVHGRFFKSDDSFAAEETDKPSLQLSRGISRNWGGVPKRPAKKDGPAGTSFARFFRNI